MRKKMRSEKNEKLIVEKNPIKAFSVIQIIQIMSVPYNLWFNQNKMGNKN